MKKIYTTTLTILTSIICFAQRDWNWRGGSERGYEVFGLQDGDTIIESLKFAISLFIIGLLIAYIFIWRKKDIGGVSTYAGCVVYIIMLAGVIFLIPLLSWVEYIFVIIMKIGFAIFAIVLVGAIIYGIYSEFIKKVK